MKIAAILPFVLYASLAAAKLKKPKKGGGGGSDQTEDQQPTDTTETDTAVQTDSSTLDVGSVISSFYLNDVPTIAASASTALATGLLDAQSSWFQSPECTAADAAISLALPASLSASVAASRYQYADILTADWFTSSVPAPLQTAVAGYVSKLESVHFRYVPSATAGSAASNTAGSGALMTAAPLQMAGLVGVVGGIVVAVL